MKTVPPKIGAKTTTRSWEVGQKRPVMVLNQAHAYDDAAWHYDMHYELEMGVVIEGSMERHTRDSSRVCHAGEMWFTGIWEPHGFRSDGNCHRVVLVIWPPALSEMRFAEAPEMNLMQPFLLRQELRPVIPPELRSEVVTLVRHHLSFGRNISSTRQRLFVTELLAWLFDKGLVTQSAGESQQEQMMSIGPAIERVFSERSLITNEDAARLCGLSRDIFIRTFRKLMGVSFRQFAVRYRLSRAAGQLHDTDLPIKAIAREWGFTDESHLHRLFKQHYDCTPLAYRQINARGVTPRSL